MTAYRPNRNLVTRHADGKQVNVARCRGNLFVCADACCCGRADLGNAPIPTALYDAEWQRRRLRNFVHLTIGGCLGPCALANVNLLLLDGRALWFHSLNSKADVVALFDFIEGVLDGTGPSDPPEPLASHLFTASTWQPRPDGQPLDDARSWGGREARPDATPACELPPEAFLPQGYVTPDLQNPKAKRQNAHVDKAIAAMSGLAALPRSNGEVVFAEPWEGRAFGIAVALHESGAFEWGPFRQRLIARIAEAERTEAAFSYYRCWLAALEDVLVASGLVAPGAAAERTFEFEFGERQDVY